MPPSRVDGAAAEPRTGSRGAPMARGCSFVHRLQLLLVEGRDGTVRAKHERSRLGLVTRLETLVHYQTHQEAWLERYKHWLGSQGRALDRECTKALFYYPNNRYENFIMRVFILRIL